MTSLFEKQNLRSGYIILAVGGAIGGYPFHWQAHAGRFNYIWLNEVIHLKQLEVIWKDCVSNAEKANTAMFSAMSHGLHDLLWTSGSACRETDPCSWVVGISTFLNPDSLGWAYSKDLRREPSGLTLILPGQQDAFFKKLLLSLVSGVQNKVIVRHLHPWVLFL